MKIFLRKGWNLEKKLKIGLICLIGLIGLISFIFFTRQASAAWFDDSFSYRQKIEISNSSTIQTNYQIKILSNYNMSALVSAGKLQSNLNDLRFTDINGKTIKYWIEDATNSSVDIWAVLPSLPASGTTIYMYYGNSSASAGSSVVGTPDFPGLSCKAVKLSGGTTNALYYLDPNGGNTADAFKMLCELTVDGGGWTVLINHPASASTQDPFTDYGTVSVAGPYSIWSKNTSFTIDQYLYKPLYNANLWATATKGVNGGTTTFNAPVAMKYTDTNGTQYTYTSSANVYPSANNPAYSTGCSGYTPNGGYGLVLMEYPPSGWCTHTGYGFGLSGGDMRGCHFDSWKWNWGGSPGGGNTCPDPAQFQTGNSYIAVKENSITVPASVATVGTPSGEEKTPGPAAYWKFDEGQGTIARDSVSGGGVFNATGGTITESGGYRIHTFTGNGTFTPTASGKIEVLVVGGGGGGGMDMGGGGGGGGVVYNSSLSVTGGSAMSVVVGGGGAGAPAAGTGGQPAAHQYTIPATAGQNSSFGGLTATGGGLGGSSYYAYTPGASGGSGGSGGGTSGYSDGSVRSGGAGTAGQGYAGGQGGGQYYSGGGGGAGGAGTSSTNQPNGGIGYYSAILGTGYYWGGGGGGAGYSAPAGNGGLGGGGGGSGGGGSNATGGGQALNSGVNGQASCANCWAQVPGGNGGINTGGGGGGGSHYNSNNKGGDGGTGIVIIRYPITKDGTLSGATWQSEDMCISGKCLNFNGTNNYVNVPDNTGLQVESGDFTISAWVKPATVRQQAILFKANPDMTSSGYSLIMNRSGNDISLTKNGVADQAVSYTFQPNTWYHIVAVQPLNGNVTYYINGKSIGSYSNTSSYQSSSGRALYVGDADTYFANKFIGQIDDVKVYPYARSADQIKMDYNTNAAAATKGSAVEMGTKDTSYLSNGLVGYWKMNETSGTAISDVSGNSFTGTIGANNTFSSGKYGNALNNPGTSAGATVSYTAGSALDLTSSSRPTVAVWLKITSLASSARLIEAIASGGLAFEYNGDGSFSYGTFSGNAVSWPAGTLSADSLWHHIVVTYDGTNAYLYKDGALVSAKALTANWSSTSNKVLNIGGDASYPLRGSVDEVRIYNRPLSSSEVSQLYNYAPGPVGYWNFEEGSGTVVNDSSSYSSTPNKGSWSGTSSHWVAGMYGKAGNFNGTDDYVSITDPGAGSLFDFGNGSNITLEGWIKPSILDANYRGIIYKRSGNYTNYALRKKNSADGTIEFFYRDSGDTAWHIWQSTNSVLSLNSWNHVALTYTFGTGSSIKLYINGTLVAGSWTVGDGNTAPYQDNTPVTIGGISTQYFQGAMDEAKIYNYARTAKQITEDMNANHPAVGSPVGSPLGYWKFNEGTDNTCTGGTNDACNSGNGGSSLDGAESGMSIPATATSGWTNSGKFGKALIFDGTDDSVNVGDNPFDMGTGNFSVSAWIKNPSHGNNWNGIFGKDWSTNPGNPGFVFATGYGGLSFSIDANVVNYSANGPSRADDDTWHHVAATVNRTGNMIVYRDGIAGTPVDISASSAVSLSNSEALTIGNGWHDITTTFFVGQIDEPKIYNYALTADEVKTDFNQGQSLVLGAISTNASNQPQSSANEYCVPGDTTSCAGPVAEYKLEEGTGTSAKDTSGNGRTGTLTGATTLPTWITGKIGKAVNFDGSDDYITIADFADAGNSYKEISAFAWFKGPGKTNGKILGHYDTGATQRSWVISCGVYDNTKLRIALSDDGTQNAGHWKDYESSMAGCDSTWHYLGFSFNNGALKLFVDGKEDFSPTKTNDDAITTVKDSSAAVTIGANLSSGAVANPIAGIIDQASIYNYVRTPAQIAWDYNKGKPLGHWKFNECQGTVANDSSGNNYSGTITIGGTGSQTTAGTCTTPTNGTGAWYNGRNGKYSASMNFDGTDDYVAITNTSNRIIPASNAAFSFSMWVKPAVITATAVMTLMKNETYATSGFRFGIDTPGSGYGSSINSFWFWSTESGGGIEMHSSSSVSTGTWYNVIVSYSGSNATMYVNGVAVATDSSGSVVSNTNDILVAFPIGGKSWYNGQVDDVKFFNYAVNATQVQQVYNEGSAVRYGP